MHGSRARHWGRAAAAALLSTGVAAGAGAGGTWQELPSAPIDMGTVQTGVWTGREALFTLPGKNVRTAVGFNPATRRWRRLPRVAGPPYLAEGGDRSVWTGTEWIVWGQVRRGLAAYRPATNRWRTLPAPPVALPNATVVWTGSKMIGWGGGCCGDFGDQGAEYTAATGAWRRLPSAPLSGRQSAAGAWTGTEFVIAGGTRDEQRGRVLRSMALADAAAYNPATRTWRRLPSMPAARRDAAAVWDGRDLLVVGGIAPGVQRARMLAGVFAYRPSTGRWRALRPMPNGRGWPSAVWTGRRLLVWGGTVLRAGREVTPAGGLSYDPAANRWSAIPAAPVAGRNSPTVVWTGRSLIVAGGNLRGQPRAAAFTPAR